MLYRVGKHIANGLVQVYKPDINGMWYSPNMEKDILAAPFNFVICKNVHFFDPIVTHNSYLTCFVEYSHEVIEYLKLCRFNRYDDIPGEGAPRYVRKYYRTYEIFRNEDTELFHGQSKIHDKCMTINLVDNFHKAIFIETCVIKKCADAAPEDALKQVYCALYGVFDILYKHPKFYHDLVNSKAIEANGTFLPDI